MGAQPRHVRWQQQRARSTGQAAVRCGPPPLVDWDWIPLGEVPISKSDLIWPTMAQNGPARARERREVPRCTRTFLYRSLISLPGVPAHSCSSSLADMTTASALRVARGKGTQCTMFVQGSTGAGRAFAAAGRAFAAAGYARHTRSSPQLLQAQLHLERLAHALGAPYPQDQRHLVGRAQQAREAVARAA